MTDPFDGSSVAIPFGHLSSPPTDLLPFPIDPWVASSLLQKAIRRGEADVAASAALTLFRLRRAAIWRRFMVIAFEDVGAASIDALLVAVRAAIDPGWRANVGGDERVIAYVARLLAEAPKDRSADHLICSSRSYPPWEEARRMAGSRSIAGRFDLVGENEQPLHVRAIAAWYSSGIEWGDERHVGKGDLSGLTAVFRSLGVPEELAMATRYAATRTGEPITIMVPLIWLRPSGTNIRPSSIAPCLPLRPLEGCPFTPSTCTPPSARARSTNSPEKTKPSAKLWQNTSPSSERKTPLAWPLSMPTPPLFRAAWTGASLLPWRQLALIVTFVPRGSALTVCGRSWRWCGAISITSMKSVPASSTRGGDDDDSAALDLKGASRRFLRHPRSFHLGRMCRVLAPD